MRTTNTVVAALAVLTSTASAAPAANFWGADRCSKCIAASAYNGPYQGVGTSLEGRTNDGGSFGKFLHITDIHIDELYLKGSDPATMCHRANDTDVSLNIAGKYGTLGSICDTPQALMDATFDWMRENTKDVDFILYTGDSARHDRDKLVPRAKLGTLSEHQSIADKIVSTFDLQKTKFIPTFGNNDQFDYNKMAAVADPIIANLTDIWAPFGLGLDTNTAWKKGGYFSYEVKPGLVVINLNSMLLFSSNILTKDCSLDGSAGAEMLAWMENTLNTIRSNGKRAYIMQHVPPTSASGKALYFPGCQKAYIDLIGKYAGSILGSFFGHTNSDYVSFIYTNNTVRPTDGPFFISTITDQPPTVNFDKSCVLHVMSQGPSIIPANNPAVRVYKYSTASDSMGALISYVQYWSDLVQDNTNDAVTYDVEYTTAKTYSLWNLAPHNWAKVFQQWSRNSASFQDYVRYRFVQNPNPDPK
ncbi:Metallo-dependent phosphatase-like protein [Powellomyces hirtus]|nr:Metallo-dependent phosphatase-like protein [Powellomyces hirtus]